MKDFLLRVLDRVSEITRIPADKLAHFGVNLVLAMFGFYRFWLAVGLCVGASLGKEYGDKHATGNKWSWGDILADALGAILGLTLVVLLKGGVY